MEQFFPIQLPCAEDLIHLSYSSPFLYVWACDSVSKANKAEVLWALLSGGRDPLEAAPRISMCQCGWKEIIYPTVFPEPSSHEGSFMGSFSIPERAFCSFFFYILPFCSLIQFSYSFQKSTSVDLLKEAAEIPALEQNDFHPANHD